MTDPGRIAELRARYEALRRQGQAPGAFDAHLQRFARIPRALPEAAITQRSTVPAHGHWHARVPAGTCLRLDNVHGSPGVSCLLWNAHDPSERFCATDTVKVQWTSNLGRGRMLLSDMGRVLVSIVEDTCGRHDPLLGSGAPRPEGDGTSPLQARNGAESLLIAAAKLGLGPRDLHAPMTFFAPVQCRAQRFAWNDAIDLAGTYVDLHAEMDLLVAVANTPHPLAPVGAPAHAIGICQWRPPQADANAICRTATAEAQRAYGRTHG